MCKYCNFTEVNEYEQINTGTTIIEIRDGRTILHVDLYRYHSSDGSSRLNELILERCIDSESYGMTPVEDCHINIKYCPFCGEEL